MNLLRELMQKPRLMYKESVTKGNALLIVIAVLHDIPSDFCVSLWVIQVIIKQLRIAVKYTRCS